MRIAAKPLVRYPWYLRPFFWKQRRKYGAVLDSALLWGRAPRLFLGVATLYGMIDRRSSPIEPRALAQCAISTGTVIDCSTLRDAPPSTSSRARLWP